MIDLDAMFAGIKEVNSQVPEIKHYVQFYKDSGNVISVTNSLIEDTVDIGCAAIPKDKAFLYLSGQRLLSDLSVQFDTKLKKYVLVDSDKVERLPLGLFQVKHGQKEDIDLTITRDVKNKVWKLSLGESMRKSIVEHKLSLKNWINLYITKPNDPNALIRSVDTQLEKLINREEVKVAFYKAKGVDTQPFSVYTSRYFDSYQLVDLKDEQ